MDFFEDGNKLARPHIGAGTGLDPPSDTSFTSYQSALAHVQGAPLPVDTEVVWNQGFFDTLLEYDLGAAAAQISLHPVLHCAGAAGCVVSPLSSSEWPDAVV